MVGSTKKKYELNKPMELSGHYNTAYQSEENVKDVVPHQNGPESNGTLPTDPEKTVGSLNEDEADTGIDRAQWSNSTEFLLSCIAMSVGLGNIWRFPFTAYENGGGAFLIPYLIVLFVISKPLYFMELCLGQFCSYGPVKAWKVVPLVKGVGYGQMIGTTCVYTYYCSLMALTVYYFFASFQSVLPWTVCDPDWGVDCSNTSALNQTLPELYFYKTVLKESDNILNGLGAPDLYLSLCLLFSWIVIYLVIIKGVQSSGKVAYFTALFPYVVLITLLIRGVTLPGAGDGVLYFLTPQWEKILTPKVWYAAVTQSFFSLSVGFGPIIMYSSYNPFRHRLARDAFIISIMDTLTSILAGCTIFAILGNLALESNKPIDQVVKGGTGLAFVSYPDAIAKFDFVPQLFSVLFFLMLFTLGVGSAVSLVSSIITIICDQLELSKLDTKKRLGITTFICLGGFFVGLVYVTPGGQYILELVDFFGGTFVIIIMALIEIIALSYVYGLSNFCTDVEFMLEKKVNMYWKICWGFTMPFGLGAILLYFLIEFTPPSYNGPLPIAALASGWVIFILGITVFVLCAIHAIYSRKEDSLWRKMCASIRPTKEWGPKNPFYRSQWLIYKEEARLRSSSLSLSTSRLINRLRGKKPSTTATNGQSNAGFRY